MSIVETGIPAYTGIVIMIIITMIKGKGDLI